MGEQFQPGDMVEWIGDDCARKRCVDEGLDGLTDAAIYVVWRVHRAAIIRTTNLRGLGLEIEGHLHPAFAYPAEYFRKLYRPSADLIERLIAEPIVVPPVRRTIREDA